MTSAGSPPPHHRAVGGTQQWDRQRDQQWDQPHSPIPAPQPHPSPALCHLALPRSDLELCPAPRQLQLLCSSSPGPHSSPPVPPTSKAASNGRGHAEPQLHVPTPTQRSRQPGARRGPRRLRGSAATTAAPPAGAQRAGAPTRPQPRGSGDATALGSCWGTGRGRTRRGGGAGNGQPLGPAPDIRRQSGGFNHLAGSGGGR